MNTTRDEIEQRFLANLDRVRNVVAAYEGRVGPGGGRPTVSDADLLRAAVVLLHATLEDLIRSVLAWKLPRARAEGLRDVPLVGTKSSRLTLADLAAHRGLLVEDVIRDSVDAMLEYSNFNNTSEVAGSLDRVGIDPKPLLDRDARALDALMKRRHWIVHRLDRNPASGRGHHAALPLSKAAVDRWARVIHDLGAAICAAG